MNDAVLDVRKYFAEFAIRMAGIALDLFLVIFLVVQVILPAIPSIAGTPLDTMPAALALLSLYFAGFWASPLKATPVQLLFGMRVVDLNGERLTVARALLRAAVLMGLVGATLMFFRTPGDPWQLAGIIGFALLIPAIVTVNRQGAHDLLAGSIVVNRSALSSTKKRTALLQHLADPESATRPKRRPSIPRITLDILLLAISVYVLWSVLLIAIDRNIYSRVAYALDTVAELEVAVEMHYALYDQWPAANDDIGVPTWERYPDGGYYELGESGVIRIHFEVLRELKSGSLVLRPEVRDDNVVWSCGVEGYIAKKHLPRGCR